MCSLATLHRSCFAFFMVTRSRFAAFFFAASSAAVLHVFHLQPSFFLATLHGSCFAFFMVTGSRFAAFFFSLFRSCFACISFAAFFLPRNSSRQLFRFLHGHWQPFCSLFRGCLARCDISFAAFFLATLRRSCFAFFLVTGSHFAASFFFGSCFPCCT